VFVIIPSKGDTTIEVAHPVFDNAVHLSLMCSKKVLQVLDANIFDAKVVHAQIEPYRL
jgi:hypothetical protein